METKKKDEDGVSGKVNDEVKEQQENQRKEDMIDQKINKGRIQMCEERREWSGRM